MGENGITDGYVRWYCVLLRLTVAGWDTLPVTAIVDMNGSTDYIEFYVFQTNSAHTNRTLTSDAMATYAQGHRLA